MVIYTICKYLTFLTSKIYYDKIVVSGAENLPSDKPVLLLLNHPNSFLDAILVAAYLKRSTHFLARGDVFKNKLTLPILNSFNMLPLYRLSEGKENLYKNSETFNSCQAIFNKSRMVIMFPEGLCENNYDLRALRKGPARIASYAWNSNTPSKDLQILPVGLTYENFAGAGKNILINFGIPFGSGEISNQENAALFVKEFNKKVYESLGKLIYLNKNLFPGTSEHESFRAQFQKLVNDNKSASQIIKGLHEPTSRVINPYNHHLIQQTLVFWPLYSFCVWLTRRLIRSSIFFDSISFGLFLFLWPIYLLLIILTLYVCI